MSRAKKEKEVFGEDKLVLTPEDKRFATPAVVALYRAERLRCNTIVDLCSGAGFQSFAFAQTCKHVIAVEKNPVLFAKAQEHAQKLGISNITFLCGDALSADIIAQIQKTNPDIVFCDPERFATEEQRSVSTMQPDIPQLLAQYSALTSKIAIEFPPHIQALELPSGFSAEQEYISLDGAVNRLTLYFGSLMECAKKVVLLPQKEILCSTEAEIEIEYPTISPTASSASYSYLLESNSTVALAGLIGAAFSSALSDTFETLVSAKEIVSVTSGKKTFYLSTKLLSSPFFTAYRIHAHVVYAFDLIGKKKILKELQHLSCGSVVLRYTLDPAKYWEERSFFEKKLSDGTKQFHLFVFDEALVCEKI
ncbi:class I SAM-dependent methyltransferase [Candidatus Woesearchaeota archaeon]|nr:class I SAM-dependent methyltransferase [Candidatus Woesearchaeota archaeon]